MNFKQIIGQIRVLIKGCILSFLKPRQNNVLLQNLKELNYDSDLYPTILFYSSIWNVMNKMDLAEGKYIMMHHEYVENDPLYNSFNEKYTYFISDAAHQHINTYSTLLYMLNDTKEDEILDGHILLNKLFQSPKEEIHLFSNNYLNGFIKLFYVSNEKIVPLLDHQSRYVPDPFNSKIAGSDYYICNFSKPYDYEQGLDYKQSVDYINFPLILELEGESRDSDISLYYGIHGLIEQENSNGGLNGLYLKLRVYGVVSNMDELTTLVTEIFNDKSSPFLFGMGSPFPAQTASRIYNSTDKSFWYLGVSEGQTCFRNTFSPGRLPSQIVTALTRTLEDLVKSNIIYVLGNMDYPNIALFFEIIKNKFLKKDFQIVGNSFDPSKMSMSDFTQRILYSVEPGSAIINLFMYKDFLDFCTEVDKLNLSPEKVKIFSVHCPSLNYEEKYTTFKNQYCITTTHGNFKESDLYFTAYKYSGLPDYDEYTENAIVAYNTLKCAYLNSNSFSFSELVKVVYSCSVDTISGPISVSRDNYFSVRLYTLQNTGKNQWKEYTTQILPIKPEVYSWDIPSNYGYICDYNNENILEKGMESFFSVVGAFNKEGYLNSFDVYVQYLLEGLVGKTNDNSVSLNGSVYYQFVDIKSNDQICIDLLKEYMATADAIFTSASRLCIESLVAYAKKPDLLIISIGPTTNTVCNFYVINAGRHISLAKDAFDLLSAANMNFGLIGCASIFTVDYFEYIYDYINSIKGQILFQIVYDGNDFQFEKVIETILKEMDSGNIIFVGTNEMLQEFSILFNEHHEPYKLVTLLQSEHDLTNFDWKMPIYSISGYYESLDTTINKQVVADIHLVSLQSEAVTETLYLTYTMYKIWEKAIVSHSSGLSSELLNYMWNNEYVAGEGTIILGKNNIMKRHIFFSMITAEGKFEIIYQSLRYQTPYIYSPMKSNILYDCNLQENSTKKEIPTVLVGILTGLTGKDRYINMPFFDLLKVTIDEENARGGLNNRIILINFFDSESTLDGYVKQSKIISETIGISVVFGTTPDSIRLEIAQTLRKAEILYFHCTYTATESCDESIYNLGPQVTILTNIVEAYFMKHYNKFSVIYDENRPSLLFRDYIKVFTEKYNTEMVSMIEYKRNDLYVAVESIPKDVIIFLLIDYSETENFIVNIIDNSNIVYVCLDEGFLKSYPEKFVKSHIITTFTDVLIKENTGFSEQTTAFNSFFNKFGWKYSQSAIGMSGYESFLLYERAVVNSNSFYGKSLQSTVPGLSVYPNLGSVTVQRSNYINHRAFYCKIENGKTQVIFSTNQPFTPIIWSQHFNNNNVYICDFRSLTEKGSKLITESLGFGVIFDKISMPLEQIVNYIKLMDYLVESYNSKGGILTKSLLAIVKIPNNEVDLIRDMKSLINDESIKIIFGCLSFVCKKAFMDNYLDKFLFTPFVSSDMQCHPNIVSLGPTTSQLLQPTILFTRSIGIEHYVAFTDSRESENQERYVLEYLKENNGRLIETIVIQDNSEYISEKLSHLVQLINTNTYGMKRMIVLCFPILEVRLNIIDISKRFSEFSQGFIRFVFLSYVGDIPDDFSHISGSYISASFHPSISTPAVNSFTRKIEDMLGPTKVNYIHESIYYFLSIWENVINVAKEYDSGSDWPSTGLQRIALKDFEIQMSSGTYRINPNNFMEFHLSLLELTSSLTCHKVYPIEITQLIPPFSQETSAFRDSCNFGKSKAIYSYDKALVITTIFLMVLNSLILSFFVLWTIKHRKHSIITISGYKTMLVYLFSLFFISFSSIAFIIPPSNKAICDARLVMIMISWILFSTVEYGNVIKYYLIKMNKVISELKIEI